MRLALFVCSGALIAISARGAEIASDSFGYPDGSLDGKNGGTGAWINPWGNIGFDVVGGQAVSNVFANPPKYVSRVYSNPVATNEFFVSFTLTAPPAFVTADYFAAGFGVGVNNSVLAVGKGTASNNFAVGVSGLFDTGIPITPGQAYTIVSAVVYRNDPIPHMQLLWINPDGADFYNPATGAHSADYVGNESNFFHSSYITLYTNLSGVAFDNVVLGNAPADIGLLPQAPANCPGDVNNDGMTNAADFVILAGAFGSTVPPNTSGDLNGDGLVNAADFVILAGDFGCV